jgi:predicted deacylase
MIEFLSIGTDLDLDAASIQHSTVWLNYSSNRSAAGRVGIPITRIRNGDGPTVLFLAGTHGDEYEGQVVSRRLALGLQPEDIRGRILIVPSLNWPAVKTGTRLSPLDNGNLFRSYSGNVELLPTASIAQYVKSELVSRADVIVDLHSGGTSLRYTPSTQIFLSGNADYDEKLASLQKAFAAPIGIISGGVTLRASSLFGAAYAAGASLLTTELGGGSIEAHSIKVGLDGAMRLLSHLGVLGKTVHEPKSSRIVEILDSKQVIFADRDAILEPRVTVGADVQSGDEIGYLHPLTETIGPPIVLRSPVEGVVVCQRPIPLCAAGDCLFRVARPRDAA